MAEPRDTADEKNEALAAVPEGAADETPAEPGADETIAGETAALEGRAGEELGTADADAPSPEPDATVERPFVTADETERLPEGAGADAPRLRDVTGTLGDYVRARLSEAGGFVRSHRVASAALAILAVAAVALMAMAFARAGSLPSAQQVEQDARGALSAPRYSGGTYGPDDIVVLRSVDVRSTTRSASAPEGAQGRFGASGYAVAEVVLSYSGSSVSADQAATLQYASVDGAWELIGGAEGARVAWQADAGVDEQKVLRNAHLLLERADEQAASDDATASLASLYEQADVEVTSSSFDAEAQACTVDVRYVRAGAFESYTCNLTADFSFDAQSGQWALSGVEVGEGSYERSLEGVLGTWQGTFVSQETDGTKCLAARDAGLSVTVTSAEGNAISGTVSGVAHYHEHPSDDAQSCPGDLVFEDVPFEARLVDEPDKQTGSDLTFAATLPEDVGGTVSLRLGFGTSEDPAQAVALVETSYPHTGSFLFFPVDETLTYTDRLTLSRAQ